MNTTTDSRRTDEAMIAHVEWLQLSVAVEGAELVARSTSFGRE